MGERAAATVAYPALALRPAGAKGRGVFALQRFAAGDVVERAPVIVLPDPEWEQLNRTALVHSYYAWGPDAAALGLGFAAFYNHAEAPNADFVRRREDLVLEFVARRAIAPGEEITIRYGCPLWFEPLDDGQA